MYSILANVQAVALFLDPIVLCTVEDPRRDINQSNGGSTPLHIVPQEGQCGTPELARVSIPILQKRGKMEVRHRERRQHCGIFLPIYLLKGVY